MILVPGVLYLATEKLSFLDGFCLRNFANKIRIFGDRFEPIALISSSLDVYCSI